MTKTSEMKKHVPPRLSEVNQH